MTDSEWQRVKHFDESENWGDSALINSPLVFLLDEFREFLRTPIKILSGTQGQHTRNSQHYLGRAVDIVVPRGTLLDHMFTAMRFKFNGIGIYPDWLYNGEKIGGLHLDVRDLSTLFPKTYQAQWIGVKISKKTEYFPLNSANLKKFIIGG